LAATATAYGKPAASVEGAETSPSPSVLSIEPARFVKTGMPPLPPSSVVTPDGRVPSSVVQRSERPSTTALPAGTAERAIATWLRSRPTWSERRSKRFTSCVAPSISISRAASRSPSRIAVSIRSTISRNFGWS